MLLLALFAGAAAQTVLTVDLLSPLGPALSPLVFGANGPLGAVTPDPHAPYPLLRWGGNAATRYNPFHDVGNHAADWFFLNEPGPGATDVAWLNSLAAQNASGLLTVTTIGWLACSGGVWGPQCATKAPGFSVRKYGAQQSTECSATGNPSWCSADAGSGVWAGNATPVTGNDPADTSVRSANASHALAWLGRLAALPSFGSLRGVMLDNEPNLWASTHRDVHPLPTTYEELWASIVAFAAPIRAAYPHLEVHGPQSWGWCAYFNSAVQDGGDCTAGADRRAHGGTPLLQWLLQQLAAYQAQHGVLLLTHLDVHAYPQAKGVTGSAEDEPTGALRLRSTGMWADPAYVDESWIAQPVALLPRLRGWLAAANASALGIRLSVSEYSFGAEQLVTAGVAHAETLALLAREGVHEAAVWGAPAPGSPSAQAWALFLSYDGAGAAVAGAPLPANSSHPTAATAYAFAQGSLLRVLLVGKTLPSAGAAAGACQLALAWPPSTPSSTAATAQLYGFSAAAPRLQHLGSVRVACGQGAPPTPLLLGAWSATLLVLDTAACQ
jgi:hypothetical protein